MAKRGLRRQWGHDEKRLICAEAGVDGVSVSEVARRNDVSAYLISRWSRDPRFAPAKEGSPEFLPVEISGQVSDLPPDLPHQFCCRDANQIEITVPGGCTVRVRGAYDPDTLG